jgi:hypothetical protein
MEAGKFSFKFSRQTQKNLVGSSKYAYFRKGQKHTYVTHMWRQLSGETLRYDYGSNHVVVSASQSISDYNF